MPAAFKPRVVIDIRRAGRPDVDDIEDELFGSDGVA